MKELRFGSTKQALQHLAEKTGKRVVIAEESNVVELTVPAGDKVNLLKVLKQAEVDGAKVSLVAEDDPYKGVNLYRFELGSAEEVKKFSEKMMGLGTGKNDAYAQALSELEGKGWIKK